MGKWPKHYTRDLIAKDVLEIGDGYRAKNSEMGKYGLPFVRAGDVNGHVNTVGVDILDIESVKQVGSKKSQPGDVVITTKGTVGRVAFVAEQDPQFVYSPQLCYWRSKDVEVIHPRWLFYAIQSEELKHQMGWSAGQTDMAPYISLTDQRKAFYLSIPPIPEQREMAAILGAIDDKIELNRRTNDTLEAMARALFKDWFVDFGPTRAKGEGRAPYLAPDLWSLFPDRLNEDTGLPEGWELFRLQDLAEYQKRSLTPSDTPETEFEHFSIPAFDKGQSPALDLGETIMSNKTVVPAEAVLLSKLNPEISRVWLPEASDTRQQICSTEFLAFTAKGPAGRSLLYCLLRDDRFRDMLQSMVTGTSKSHQRISPPSLLGREVLAGDKALFSAFESMASSLLSTTLSNRAESRTLAQTRDLLLPKLMSGEIRLREAKEIAGGAL